MLFRRRQPETFAKRMRLWLWPRRSWQRSLRYLRSRILRLNATPHAIAAGIAAGVFSSFTPLFGLHFFIAMALAWLIAGNMATAVLGTFFGNPITFPLIWASTYEVGHLMLGVPNPSGQPPMTLGSAIWHRDLAAIWAPYLKPMLLGSLPLGLAAALLAYAVVFVAARGFQAARARRQAALPKASAL